MEPPFFFRWKTIVDRTPYFNNTCWYVKSDGKKITVCSGTDEEKELHRQKIKLTPSDDVMKTVADIQNRMMAGLPLTPFSPASKRPTPYFNNTCWYVKIEGKKITVASGTAEEKDLHKQKVKVLPSEAVQSALTEILDQMKADAKAEPAAGIMEYRSLNNCRQKP